MGCGASSGRYASNDVLDHRRSVEAAEGRRLPVKEIERRRSALLELVQPTQSAGSAGALKAAQPKPRRFQYLRGHLKNLRRNTRSVYNPIELALNQHLPVIVQPAPGVESRYHACSHAILLTVDFDDEIAEELVARAVLSMKLKVGAKGTNKLQEPSGMNIGVAVKLISQSNRCGD